MNKLAYLVAGASVVSASNIWYSLYDNHGCNNATLLDQRIVADGECVIYQTATATISTSIHCTDNTATGDWSSSIYYSSTCTGTVLGSFSATDECTCGDTTLINNRELSMLVSCTGGKPTTCVTDDPTDDAPVTDDTPASQFDVYVAQYTSDSCSKSSYNDGDIVSNYGCLNMYSDGDTYYSTMVSCTSNSETSDWTAVLYSSTGAYSCDVGGVYGYITESGSTTCGTFQTTSLFVNCAGYAEDIYSDSSSSSSNSNNQQGAIIGGIIAGVAAILILVALVYYFVIRPKVSSPSAGVEFNNNNNNPMQNKI
jgi:hypothetical protein